MQQIPKYQTKEYLTQEWIINKKSQSQIAIENGVSIITIEKWIKKNQLNFLKPKSKYEHTSELYNLNDPVFCHLLGFIATDGYIRADIGRVEIAISEKDLQLLEFYSNYFKWSCPIRTYNIKGTDKNKIVIHITSKQLLSILKELRIDVVSKTFNLTFPILPNEFSYKFFIRGILDGDGSIRKRGFRITMASYNFIASLTSFLNTKFSTNYQVTYQSKKKYPKLEISSYMGAKMLEWIYGEQINIGLQRKVQQVLIMLSR